VDTLKIVITPHRVMPGLVPVVNLKPHENTENDDNEIERYRGPILLFQMSTDPTKPHHRPSPI
jgi:hypothetical protein